MTEHAELRPFVAAEHLSASALAERAADLAASGARATVLRGFLRPEVAESLSGFLNDDAEFATGYGVHTRYGFVPREEFDATSEAQRFFRYGSLASLRAGAARRPGFQAFRGLSAALGTPGARGLFEAIIGAPLGKVTLSARRMRRGDFLARHTDDIGERVVSWVIYLSPWWEPGFGAALLLEDGAGGHVRVEAEYNSMVVFDARTWHRVADFEEAAGDRPRLTLGGWYLRPGAGG